MLVKYFSRRIFPTHVGVPFLINASLCRISVLDNVALVASDVSSLATEAGFNVPNAYLHYRLNVGV